MTNHKHITAGLAVALAGGALMASACGQGTPEATKAAARPAKLDLTRFLLLDGEQPGFRRIERVQTESAAQFTGNVPPAEAKGLRADGIVSLTFQPTEGPDARGVTSVMLFATEDGAGRALAKEQTGTYALAHFSAGTKLRHFDVPGIPGGRGWRTRRDGHHVGNVFWLQGRCVMTLGLEGPGTLLKKSLSHGALAIYKRTDGRCP